MFNPISSITGRSAILAAFLFALTGCGGEPPPPAVAPSITDTTEAPVEEVTESTVVATERTVANDEAQPRVALAPADPAPPSGRFQLGTHYERLPAAQGTSSSPDLIEVAEIFWYGCPHCYAFDPHVQNWRENLPDDVSFVHIPAVWNSLLQTHARAFYTAEALGLIAELHTPLFREIHDNRNFLDSQEALAEFFGRYGVETDAFNAAFESFAVNMHINRADELSRRYRIASVPTVIVNGKYTTDATKAGGYEELMEVIDELVAMERAGE